MHPVLTSLPKLSWLRLECCYDAPILFKLVDCLSAILSRPREKTHTDLFLILNQYPHHKEPLPEFWGKLDSALQHEDLGVNVEAATSSADAKIPIVWGNAYEKVTMVGWMERVKLLFPKALKEGRLWAMDPELLEWEPVK